MSGGAFQAKFNLGRKDSFLFNIHVFESLKTKHIGLSDFSFFEELFFKQPDYQRFAFPMETVITNNVILHKDSKILDMMLPVLIEVDRNTT